MLVYRLQREEDAYIMREKLCVGCLGLFMAVGMSLGLAAPVPVEGQENMSRETAVEKVETTVSEHKEEVVPPVRGQVLTREAGMPLPKEQPAAVNSASSAAGPEDEASPVSNKKDGNQAVQEVRKIIINLPSRSLSLYEGDKKIRLYSIAVGKPSTPTPDGYYKIRSKDVNPVWIDPEDPNDPKSVVPSGEANPLGYRWMEIQGNYGIHGTNRPNSIGGTVSNGCIRMHEEDVEELFDLVKLGTPVEINYNRVVVEKTPEDLVVYYIYPDCYGWQDVTVSQVNEWLKGYGVQCFESDEAIAEKIRSSDGNPTYIARVYGVLLDGKRIPVQAVEQNQVLYLPAMGIASAANEDLGWDAARGMLMSRYGEVKGYEKKDYLYFRADDAYRLFHVWGSMRADKLYSLVSDGFAGPVAPASPKDNRAAAEAAVPPQKEALQRDDVLPKTPADSIGGKETVSAKESGPPAEIPAGEREKNSNVTPPADKESLKDDSRGAAAAADLERPSSYVERRREVNSGENDSSDGKETSQSVPKRRAAYRSPAEKTIEDETSEEIVPVYRRTASPETMRPVLRSIDLEDEED